MRRKFILYPLLLIPLLLLSCAGPRTTLMQRVRTDLSSSRTEAAYQSYKNKVKDTQRVDELLNLGLLAFEARDYAACQAALKQADDLAEERETKSLSREAAGIAISDRMRAYQGTVFDKALIHYYRALAYLAGNQLDEAVIEGRRIASYLEVNARESKHAYKDDGFLQWFNGCLYERAGQMDDALISYRRAEEIFKNYYGLETPSFLCPAAVEAARAVGSPDSSDDCPIDSVEADYGRVIVICETGIAPPIRESNIVLPILQTTRMDFANDDERDSYYYSMYEEHERHPYYEQTELKYLLRLALPYYGDYDFGSQVVRVNIRDSSDFSTDAELGEDVGAILRQDLKDRYPSIVARAIARAIIKYSATAAAREIGKEKDEHGKRKAGVLSDVLGAIVNAAGVATEAADTRSWETLPDRIFVADFRLPPGSHELRAVFEDESGQIVMRHDFDPVEVKKGDIVFLRTRCVQ